MLTLERQEKQSIIIEHNGEQLTIILNHAHNGKAKLSFDAPDSFEIWRDEIVSDDIS